MDIPVNCNLCGANNYTVKFKKEGTQVVRCNVCGLVYTNPQIFEKGLYEKCYFEDESSGAGYASYISDRKNIVKTAHRELAQIEKLVPKGALLDVGCATGFFLDAARERGWLVQGVELSRFASGYAAKKLGLPVYTGKLKDARLKPNSLDVVTMWDYLEHSPNPRADIQKAVKSLKNSGLLVIGTPDVGCLSEKLFGSNWMQYKPREHTHYFSRATISRMLVEESFEVKKISAIGKYIPFSLFVRHLTRYNATAGKLFCALGAALGLSARSFYVNPRDTMRVYAFKR